MKHGTDFWLIARIVTAIIKVLIAILGDEDDKHEAENNGFGDMQH